jgi:hypothetical protein
MVITVEVIDRPHLHAVDVDRRSTWLDGQLQSPFGSLAGSEHGARSGRNAIKLVAEVPESNAAIEHERPSPPVAAERPHEERRRSRWRSQRTGTQTGGAGPRSGRRRRLRDEDHIPSEATRPASGPLAGGGLRRCHHRDDEPQGPDLHPPYFSEILRRKPTVGKLSMFNEPRSNVRLHSRNCG